MNIRLARMKLAQWVLGKDHLIIYSRFVPTGLEVLVRYNAHPVLQNAIDGAVSEFDLRFRETLSQMENALKNVSSALKAGMGEGS